MPMCRHSNPNHHYPRPMYLGKGKPKIQSAKILFQPTALEQLPIQQDQPKNLSLLEAVCNAVIGLCVSWMFTFWGLPFFGVQPDAWQATWITLAYFILSLVRSYALRRFFNRA